jgi:hypothetical protein
MKPACVGDSFVRFERIADGLKNFRQEHCVADLHLRVGEFVKSGFCESCQLKFFAEGERQRDEEEGNIGRL